MFVAHVTDVVRADHRGRIRHLGYEYPIGVKPALDSPYESVWIVHVIEHRNRADDLRLSVDARKWTQIPRREEFGRDLIPAFHRHRQGVLRRFEPDPFAFLRAQ